MENHPIPQDVTGFQFKLIGDMTIKQFAYLAGGCILAYIFFSLPLPTIIKLPLSFLFLILGLSLAFVPVEGRPLDVLFSNYLRALFVPNLYLYQKVGGQLSPVTSSKKVSKAKKVTESPQKEKVKVYLQNLIMARQRQALGKNALDVKEMSLLSSLAESFAVSTAPLFPSEPSILPVEPSPSSEKKEDEEKKVKEALEKEAAFLKKELEEVKKEEQKPGVSPLDIHQKVLELEKQLNETLSQKQQLEKEFLVLQQRLQAPRQSVFKPSTARPQAQETPHIRNIPKEMERKVGTPISHDVPNLIRGIVKNPRDHALTNILVEVKDQEGNPVRAFKTNALGQFASATPLNNGTYTVEFEDPDGKNKFDMVEIVTSGEVIPPLEVISTDDREELRRALFPN